MPLLTWRDRVVGDRGGGLGATVWEDGDFGGGLSGGGGDGGKTFIWINEMGYMINWVKSD